MLEKLGNKELSVLELFWIGFMIYKNNLISILIIALFVNLPMAVISESIYPAFKHGDYGVSLLENYFIRLILNIVEMPVCIAVMNVVEQNVLDKPINWKLALRKVFFRWGTTLINSIWSVFLAIFTFFILFVSGLIFGSLGILVINEANESSGKAFRRSSHKVLYLDEHFSSLIQEILIFFVRHWFLFEAVALRDLKWSSALSYSRSLVQGRWWKVFLKIIALCINYLFIEFIAIAILLAMDQFIPTLNFIIGISFNLLCDLNNYFFIIVRTLFFLNLEYRKS